MKTFLDKYNNNLVFVAKSPVFWPSLESNTLVSSVDLPIEREIGSDNLRKKEVTSNGNFIVTGVETVSGFSIYSKLPKAKVTAARIGSAFFYELSNVDENILYKLAKLKFLGIPPFSYSGFNILEVLDDAKYAI